MINLHYSFILLYYVVGILVINDYGQGSNNLCVLTIFYVLMLAVNTKFKYTYIFCYYYIFYIVYTKYLERSPLCIPFYTAARCVSHVLLTFRCNRQSCKLYFRSSAQSVNSLVHEKVPWHRLASAHAIIFIFCHFWLIFILCVYVLCISTCSFIFFALL